MLRKLREALELNAEIEATTAKINYLREAEFNLYGSDKIAAEATADASAATQLDERLQHSLHLQGRISPGPVVRPKTGVHVQFPLFDSALDRSPGLLSIPGPLVMYHNHNTYRLIVFPLPFPYHNQAPLKPLSTSDGILDSSY